MNMNSNSNKVNNPETQGFLDYTFKICGKCTKVDEWFIIFLK